MSIAAAQIHQLRPVYRNLTLVALGAIAGLGQAPWDAWWATIASFALLLAFFQSVPGNKRAFATGWVYGFGYFATTLHWIVEPFLIDMAATGWMAPFALILMASGAALFWGVAAWLASWLGTGAFGLVMTIVLAEITRSLILTGFPWALVGHIWIATPVAQIASVVGPHGLTLIALGLAWSLAALAQRKWWAIAGPLVVTAVWFFGMIGPAPTYDGPVVRLVQPNVPQADKWDPEKRVFYFNQMIEMTGAAPRPDLIVWPETAVPTLMDYAQPTLDEISEAAQGVPLITGINRSNGRRYHNSFVVLGQGGVVDRIYDKAHLAPFGEYIPGGEWLLKFGINGLAASQGRAFTPGGVQPLVDLPGIGAARALICYEGIFAEEIGTRDRPRVMILITNDAWFGQGAGPRQHLAQAQLRAIEQGLPMVRVANTGISAMIDGKGRITDRIPLGVRDARDVPLPPALPPTLYTWLGDIPAILLALLSLTALAGFARRVR